MELRMGTGCPPSSHQRLLFPLVPPQMLNLTEFPRFRNSSAVQGSELHWGCGRVSGGLCVEGDKGDGGKSPISDPEFSTC